jgi:hypothetical protein
VRNPPDRRDRAEIRSILQYKKSPGQCRGFCVLGECCGSIPGSNRPAELVIHPDPQHVVCNPRALATVEEAAAKGGAGRQIVSGNLAEVNIEIFELGGPVAPSAPSTPTPTVQPILVLVLGNAAGTTPMASLALTSP